MYTKIDLSGLSNFHSRKLRHRSQFGRMQMPDRCLILLAICYLLGVFLGVRAIDYLSTDLKGGIVAIFSNFMEIRAEQTLQQTAVSSFLQNFVLIAILFLLGFCAISLPLIPCVVLFKGMGYGVTVSAMLEYGNNGISLLRLGLLIVPFAVVSALIVLAAAKQAVHLSIGCYRTLRDGKGERDMGIAEYCRVFFVLILCIAFSSAADALLYSLFAPGLFY